MPTPIYASWPDVVRPGADVGGSISRAGPFGGPSRPWATARVHCVLTVPIGADGA